MKIVYCIHSLYNSAGMERIITEKANALSEKGYKVFIITAEQQNRPLFYQLDSQVVHYDLGINYTANNSFLSKLLTYAQKKRKHRKKLSQLLFQIKPDITISTMGNEFLFLYKIKDKSKKILEIHFAKNYRMMYKRDFLWKLIDLYRSKQEEKKAAHYDRFVVLTQEDKTHWKELNNIITIPNFITLPPTKIARKEKNKNLLIAVGRLAYQKGFDRLINACALIKEQLKGWEIHIYGNGELKQKLEQQIQENGLSKIISIHPATSNINQIYAESKGILSPSRFEGFGLVLIEAMSYGVPPIAFKYPCGPQDIITNNIDGILVENNDIAAYSEAILRFINNESLRTSLSSAAIEKSKLFSKEYIMNKWVDLFNELQHNN